MSELNQAKRTETITQAQLADVSGDKMFADNCNFISRLNLDPINGAQEVFITTVILKVQMMPLMQMLYM